MLHRTLERPYMRMAIAAFGTALYGVAINLFLVPAGFYTGGILGFCQVIRTLLIENGFLANSSFDPASLFFYVANIPFFVLGFTSLSRKLVFKTLASTTLATLVMSLTPIPTVPIVEDSLTACAIAGILVGIGCGLVLLAGYSSGGMDILGIYLSKKKNGFSVGKLSISVNIVLFTVCAIIFEPAVAIYSIIYTMVFALIIDHMHEQNIIMQATIFTKLQGDELPKFIMERMQRGITYWNGIGAYTQEDVRVMVIYLSKYEAEDLRQAVHQIDPNALFIVQSGIQLDGNFTKRLTK